MKKIPDHRIGQILALSDEFAAKASAYAKDNVFNAALLAHQILSQIDTDDMSAADVKDVARVCARITDEMPLVDEPEFSMNDYADALANANQAVSFSKLLALDDESFPVAMIWLATDKRETYCGQGHAQGPLEVDVFA